MFLWLGLNVFLKKMKLEIPSSTRLEVFSSKWHWACFSQKVLCSVYLSLKHSRLGRSRRAGFAQIAAVQPAWVVTEWKSLVVSSVGGILQNCQSRSLDRREGYSVSHLGSWSQRCNHSSHEGFLRGDTTEPDGCRRQQKAFPWKLPENKPFFPKSGRLLVVEIFFPLTQI